MKKPNGFSLMETMVAVALLGIVQRLVRAARLKEPR